MTIIFTVTVLLLIAVGFFINLYPEIYGRDIIIERRETYLTENLEDSYLLYYVEYRPWHFRPYEELIIAMDNGIRDKPTWLATGKKLSHSQRLVFKDDLRKFFTKLVALEDQGASTDNKQELESIVLELNELSSTFDYNEIDVH